MAREPRAAFRRIATAGVLFQGGAAAVDTSTIVAALVGWMTGSPVAVGAAAAISRYGWLFPQLVVGWLAESKSRRMSFYKFGAFGRVVCLALVALLVGNMTVEPPPTASIVAFFGLFTLYAFVSGVVAVPYNDIVARAVPSDRRSRLLAIRMFGGGLLGVAVAALASGLLGALPAHAAFAAILGLGALLLALSATFFVSAGEPELGAPPPEPRRFRHYLGGVREVWVEDPRFRRLVGTQWLGGVVQMALPFYVVVALERGLVASDIGLLLVAQTAGAIASNPLWGWWGDVRGKSGLLAVVALTNGLGPLVVLAWMLFGSHSSTALPVLALAFVALGAAGNGTIIAQLGLLMEISPDDWRPSYSGYFNALVAPASLLPLAGAAVVSLAGAEALFAAAIGAAALQHVAARSLDSFDYREGVS